MLHMLNTNIIELYIKISTYKLKTKFWNKFEPKNLQFWVENFGPVFNTNDSNKISLKAIRMYIFRQIMWVNAEILTKNLILDLIWA